MIPKVIHYCWFGGNPLPALMQKCIESWKKYCPDYEIIRWDESNYDVTKNEYMYQAYKAQKWAFVPDFARLDIIYNHGGLYFDTDVEIVKPIDDLLANKAFLGMERPGLVAMGLVIGAEKGNRLFEELMHVYDKINFINENGSLNLKTSLDYCEPVFHKYGLREEDTEQYVADFHVYPTEYFCPKAGYGTDIHVTENTYTIHHYTASWVPLNRKLRGRIYYCLNCLFGKKFADTIRRIFGKTTNK